MTNLVLRKDHESWTLLTLNRPDKLNALTVDLFKELRLHVEAIKDDVTVNCVVLRGAGKCFSAGHDLAEVPRGFNEGRVRSGAGPAVNANASNRAHQRDVPLVSGCVKA